MTRIIIHIGTHKTGTTAFQEALIREQKLIEQKGIYYQWMDLNHGKHSSAYANIGGERATPESRKNFVDQIKAAAHSNRTLILSEEGLSEPGEVFAETLAPLVDIAKVTIVCALRPQHELLERLWAQRIRERRTKLSIEEFTETKNSIERCKYHRMLSHWTSRFGSENVRVVDYKYISSDSANGLLEAAGVNHTISSKIPRQNWTPNVQTTRLLEYLNSSGAKYDVQRILEAGRPIDDMRSYSLMKFEQKLAIEARFKEENQLLLEEFGIRFSSAEPSEVFGKIDEEDFNNYFLSGFRARHIGMKYQLLFHTKRIIDKCNSVGSKLIDRIKQ